ncbi:MAG: DNA repair protein RecO [Phycisphaeraceae bacterium]|nr:DNA repair protein RecO [Phycisphaeraceae bacterium]
MPRFKDQAICVRRMDWSETSELVTLLTAEHGLVRGLAKGSKRMSPGSVAKFSGGIELLTLGQVLGSLRSAQELANITEWDLQEPYRGLRLDWAAQQTSLYAADLVSSLLAEHDPHPVSYEAMRAFLDGLTTKSAASREEVLALFQWRLLTDTGYQPVIDRDARTGQALSVAEAYWFDPQAGGFAARGDNAGEGTDMRGVGPWRVRAETLTAMRAVALQAGDLNGSSNPNPVPRAHDPATLGRVNRLLCVYVRSIVDRALPTMGYVLGEG